MWNTGQISAEIAACDIGTTNGIGHIAYVININDIDKSATVITDFAIDHLHYNPGAAAFMCAVLNTDEPEGNVKLIKGNYRDGWDHNIKLRFCINDTAIRLRLDECLHSRVCVVIQLWDAAGKQYFEILGYELGLEITDVDRNYNDEDTAGGWVVALACDDTYKEKDFPYILGTAPGTIVIDATEVGAASVEITDVDVVAGVVTITTPDPVPAPVAAHLINRAGEVQHYNVQRIDNYHQRINIGDQLPVGTYTVKILYTS
jgi:hypothetical protein